MPFGGTEHPGAVVKAQPASPAVRRQPGRTVVTRVVADCGELPIDDAELVQSLLQVGQLADGERALVGVRATGVEERPTVAARPK